MKSLTVDRFRARWATARAAPARADGLAASTLYAEVPIDLEPQVGLVPIGKNPATGLREFYHLRSAWNPLSGVDPATFEIPEHNADDGAIAVSEDTGIVFVLVPGGEYTIGSQLSDPDARFYDLGAQAQTTAAHPVGRLTWFACAAIGFVVG